MKGFVLAATLCLAPAAALAETNVWQTGGGFTIRTGDIDRSTADGRATLLKRVEFAGRKLCKGVAPRKALETCITESTARVLDGGPDGMRRSLQLAIEERNGKQAWAAR